MSAARSLRPTWRALALGLAALVGSTVLVAGPAQASPNLDQAKAKAATLRHQLARLQLQQSIAVETYDGLQDQLQQAVSSELSNGDQASASAQEANAASDAVADRARALYMSGGGQLGLMFSVLTGASPADVLENAQSVSSVIQADNLTAQADQANAAKAAAVAQASVVNRQKIVDLQAQAATSLTRVQSLLTEQHTLISKADHHVVRIARQEQRAAEAAALARASSTGRAAGVPVGSGDSGRLPSTIDGPNDTATQAIAAARTRLGDPYLWGAVGPSRFDCSGLMMWSYKQAGLTLPRTSRAQYAGLPHVALADLQPGDLVFYATDTSNPGSIHHVAMYLGDGLVINAPHTGDVVRYAPVSMPGLMAMGARPTL